MVYSSFWRLAIAVSCMLLMVMTLSHTAFAKSASMPAQSLGPITDTTDMPCNTPVPLVQVRLSGTIPRVTLR
jgi:hypothetical protein